MFYTLDKLLFFLMYYWFFFIWYHFSNWSFHFIIGRIDVKKRPQTNLNILQGLPAPLDQHYLAYSLAATCENVDPIINTNDPGIDRKGRGHLK